MLRNLIRLAFGDPINVIHRSIERAELNENNVVVRRLTISFIDTKQEVIARLGQMLKRVERR